jgi:hypothetical protein
MQCCIADNTQHHVHLGTAGDGLLLPAAKTLLAYSVVEDETAASTPLALACTGACSCFRLFTTLSSTPHDTTTWDSRGSAADSFPRHRKASDCIPACVKVSRMA